MKKNISTSDAILHQACHSEYDHRYSCLLSESSRLLQHGVTYTFQAASQNRYGLGPSGDSVFGMVGITSIVKLLLMAYLVVVIISVGTTCNNSVPNVASVSPDYFTCTASSEAITVPNQTSEICSWILFLRVKRDNVFCI